MILSTTHTLDGVKVEPGLRVWDYDLNLRVVGERSSKWDDADPWYRMIDPETGREGSTMNCSRMWVRHPANGAKA